MVRRVAALALASAMVTGTAGAQTPKASTGTNDVTHDVTIKADSIYTGTIRMAIAKGRVTGDLHLTSPTVITGKLAGTAKAGVLALDFPYHMVERKCDGTVKMNLTLPATPGPATGTMEAVGCGRDETSKLLGTVELTPRPAKK